MEKIIKEKGEGKTQKLIEKSHQSGDYIVCHSLKEAQRIHELARKQGYTIPLPISYEEFIRGNYYSRGVRGVLIDNIEYFAEFVSKVPVEAITVTPEND